MGDRLTKQAAIVTGAGRGIGKQVAVDLAAEGACIVAVDPGVSRNGQGFDTTPVDETVNEIIQKGGRAIANYSSVTDFKACEDIIKSCVDNFGRLDILANFAGIVRPGMIWELSDEDWDMVMKVHVYGTFNTTRWASRIMKEQRHGRIINVTGSGAFLGQPGNPNYNAAKGAIVSFSRSVATELAGFGITCNTISPVAFTRMADKASRLQFMKRCYEIGLIEKDVYEEQLSKTESTDRNDGPEYVTPLVVYLCTKEASTINGKIFTIEKGAIGVYDKPRKAKEVINNGEIWTVAQLAESIPKMMIDNTSGPLGIKLQG